VPQHEVELTHGQTQDQQQEVKRRRVQPIQAQPRRDLLETIQSHDQQQHGRLIVRHALIQPQDQRDLRPVRARLREQEPDQVHQQEAEAAVAVALQEEEIIRYKYKIR
jgi:hypothetical protein